MGKSTPSAPPAPDPNVVARAQTGSNVNTAVANSILGNANVYGPTGSTTYRQTGTTRVGDQDVPQFEQTNTLSPEQQVLYDQQVKLGQGMNNLAMGQVDRLSSTMSTPFASGAAGLQRLGPAPQMDNKDYSADRQRVEAALMSRAMPELDRQRNSLESRLANQGIALGSEAYSTGVDESNRARNDAIFQAILAGGQEQSRLVGLDRDRIMTNFGLQRDTAGFNNDASNAQFQRDLTTRNQPINEISALMSGGQVSMPNFGQYQGGTVAGTPVGQYTYDSNAIQQAQFNNEQQRRTSTTNAMLGGLFGLGSAAIMPTGLFRNAGVRA